MGVLRLTMTCKTNHETRNILVFFINKTIFSVRIRSILNFYCSKTKRLLFSTENSSLSMVINVMLIKNEGAFYTRGNTIRYILLCHCNIYTIMALDNRTWTMFQKTKEGAKEINNKVRNVQ